MSPKTGLLCGAAAWILASLLACSSIPTTSSGGDNCPSFQDTSASSGSGGGVSTAPPTHTTDVAACAGGATQSDIDSNVALAGDMETTLNEMTSCGTIAHGFSTLLNEYFARIACGQPTGPGGGLTYAGSGLYLAGTVMQVQAKLAKDTSFGKAGDDVPFDVFDTTNYWGSVTIKASLSADLTWDTTGRFGHHIQGSYEITMDKPKPNGLELWGIPADSKPLKKQQSELAAAIAANVVFIVDVKPTPSNGVKFWLTSPPLSVGDLYNGKGLPLQLTAVEMVDPMAPQTISSMSWDLTYLPVIEGALSGSAVFSVKGGLFPYYVRFGWPKRATPDVLVSCNAPSP